MTDYAKRKKYADEKLTAAFPYNDETDYQTVGNVDYEFAGNGDNSGQLDVGIGHPEDTPKVVDFLKNLGAENIRVDEIRNRWGAYDVIKFDMPVEKIPADYGKSQKSKEMER